MEPQADGEQPGEPAAPSRALVALIGGTGRLGSALAGRFARVGHEVIIGSRDAARAEEAAAMLTSTLQSTPASPSVHVADHIPSARAGDGVPGPPEVSAADHVPGSPSVRGADNRAAASSADVVVITVPFEFQEATLRGLAEAVGDRVVLSTAVPVRFVKGAAPTHIEVGHGSASEQVAAMLPRARVVGALHTISSVTLAKLDRDLDADVLITGDDPSAKRAVADLLGSLSGIRVVDGGPLRNSRYVEQLTVLLLTINMRVRRSTGIRITNLPDEVALGTAPKSGP